jgi:hypothetical protein
VIELWSVVFLPSLRGHHGRSCFVLLLLDDNAFDFLVCLLDCWHSGSVLVIDGSVALSLRPMLLPVPCVRAYGGSHLVSGGLQIRSGQFVPAYTDLTLVSVACDSSGLLWMPAYYPAYASTRLYLLVYGFHV